jgi:hypothetical protein
MRARETDAPVDVAVAVIDLNPDVAAEPEQVLGV